VACVGGFPWTSVSVPLLWAFWMRTLDVRDLRSFFPFPLSPVSPNVSLRIELLSDFFKHAGFLTLDVGGPFFLAIVLVHMSNDRA